MDVSTVLDLVIGLALLLAGLLVLGLGLTYLTQDRNRTQQKTATRAVVATAVTQTVEQAPAMATPDQLEPEIAPVVAEVEEPLADPISLDESQTAAPQPLIQVILPDFDDEPIVNPVMSEQMPGKRAVASAS